MYKTPKFPVLDNSGIASMSFETPRSPIGSKPETSRVSFGFPDEEHSLLDELENGATQTPWVCKYVRDRSLELLDRSLWIPKETRDRMIDYGRRLPWWDHREEWDPEQYIKWVVYVGAGGLTMAVFDDRDSPIGIVGMPARTGAGHLDSEDGGLIEEMRRGLEPIPWESEADRLVVRDLILKRPLDDLLREQLLEYIDCAPVFEERP